jgi:uncharacterized protein (DUF302 family)
MPVRKVEVERFSLTTSKPFESVVSALKAGIGQLDLAAFASASKSSGTFSELGEVINRNMGETGLMLFLEFDHGAVVRKETGLAKPKIVRLVIGNPLVMKEMAKHVPDAGSYAPVTVLVDERDNGVHLSYDRMSAFVLRQDDQLSVSIRKPGCPEGRSGIGFEGRKTAQQCRGRVKFTAISQRSEGEKGRTWISQESKYPTQRWCTMQWTCRGVC